MKKIQKFLLVTSILFFLKSFISFFCYRYILFTPFDASFIAAAVPFIIGLFIIIYKAKIATFIQNTLLSNYKKEHRLYYVLTTLALIGLYFTIIFIFILSNDVLWQDEWRHFNDYLFKKDTISSILDRQNGHLMIIPNAIFLGNYYLLGAKEIWLILLNNITLLIITGITVTNLFNTLKGKVIPIVNIASCAIIALSIFWLAGEVTLFWGIGIHNNLAALGATFAAYHLSRQRIIGPFKGIVYFVIGATFSSCCFGTGVATWVLGFVAAFLLQQNYKLVLGHFMVGIFGGFLLLGYYTMSKGGVTQFELVPFIKSLPIFLGAPFIQMFSSILEESIITTIAIIIGCLGLVLLTAKVFFFWIDSKKEIDTRFYKNPEGILFHFLLAAFAVICGILIGLGRTRGDITAVLDGRFHSWAVIFWSNLLAIVLIFLAHLKTSRQRQMMMASFLGITLTGLGLFNLLKMDLRQFSHKVVTEIGRAHV